MPPRDLNENRLPASIKLESAMKILFAFENPLPNAEADAEVFVTTSRYLGVHLEDNWLHVPVTRENQGVAQGLANMPIIRAFAPLRPAALRHFLCGITIGLRREFHQADLVYTRNLWVAWMSILCGQRVVFDHYRPWPDQIPPLQRWLYKLFTHPRFLGSICHSEYTRQKYIELGVPSEKLRCIHNGFEPRRFMTPIPLADAKARIGVAAEAKTVIYTGRVNHKKGLELVIEAAKQLPQLTFLFVGSYGEGKVEALARQVQNIIVVPWQTEATLGNYIHAADVLLIPPSLQPLAKFGSTVLPLKLFFYLGSGRPILAGRTPDVAEVLKNDETALLVQPDSLEALVAGLLALTEDEVLAAKLSAGAAADSRNYTWNARAEKVFATVSAWLADAARPKPGNWGATQVTAWKRGSRRWFAHFACTRSVILPPDGTGQRAE